MSKNNKESRRKKEEFSPELRPTPASQNACRRRNTGTSAVPGPVIGKQN